MRTLSVNTIYPAFMGEVNTHGIGVSCTFIRLAGCNIRCYYKTKGILCDTPEALSKDSGYFMTTTHILEKVRRLGNRVICLTGGEPLMQDVTELLEALSNEGYYVVIETNGTKDISAYRHIRNVSFVVDVKSLSTGESSKMLESNYRLLDKADFIKFVVDTEDDFAEFEGWIATHDYLNCNVAVGTFWGSKISYQWLIKSLTEKYKNVYLNMQTHKMSCLYDDIKDTAEFEKLFIPKEL